MLKSRGKLLGVSVERHSVSATKVFRILDLAGYMGYE